MNEVERVIIDIKIDDRKGTTGRIEQKLNPLKKN